MDTGPEDWDFLSDFFKQSAWTETHSASIADMYF